MKPVYIINGFLESGKTEFITYTLAQPYFQIRGKTLLILCEEGEKEYDADLLKQSRTELVLIEAEEEFTTGRLIELEEDSGIIVNSRQLHYGFSMEHNECEFICILLSPELLHTNDWFYQNCIEPITENASCPYLCLRRNGWMASIMEKLDKIYDSFGKIPAKSSSYFELMDDYFAIMKMLYENLPDNTKEGDYKIFIRLLEKNPKNYKIIEKEGNLHIATSEEHIHKYVETITKEATCTENGIKTYTCSDCQNSYTEEIFQKENDKSFRQERVGKREERNLIKKKREKWLQFCNNL